MRVGLAIASLCAAVGCGPTDPSAGSFDATEIDPATFCTAETAEGEACKLEERVAARFDELRADPEALAAFVSSLPKGGDLHSHLSGAVHTEKLIDWAKADGLCASQPELKLQRCNAGGAPVAGLSRDDLLRAWSMQGFDGTVKEGHDHFFATFGRFGLVTRNHTADMLAAVRSEAAAQHEQYLELMLPFGTSKAGSMASSLTTWNEESLSAARDALLADEGFMDNVADSADELDALAAKSEAILGCGSTHADPGCEVEVRYLVQVWRSSTRESVFGQALYAFELAARDSRVVGLNLAAAEDNAQALATYSDVMAALAVLRAKYPPSIHVALHAGELVPALLSDADREHLTFHIREAVLTGAAERIGHGIDILSEESDDMSSAELQAAMRERGVAVEICLSSNRFILGVHGDEHPMSSYLASGVPTVVATDDEGVSRSNLSDELTTAIVDQRLGYRDVKALVRRSLIHSFAAGESLLEESDDRPKLNDACATPTGCQGLANESERARVQLNLEQSLSRFEAEIAAP